MNRQQLLLQKPQNINSRFSRFGRNLKNEFLYGHKKSQLGLNTGFLLSAFNSFAGAFSPLDIAGCKLWLDANDLTTITKDGSDFVSQWNDKSGQGNNVTQATGANQPKWFDNIRNGKDIIRFDGSNDFLQRATWTGGAIASPYTVFLVSTIPTDNGSPRYLFDGGDSSNRAACYVDDINYNMSNDFSNILTSAKTEAWRYMAFIFNGASSILRENGSNVSTGNAGSNSFNGITLANRFSFLETTTANIDIATILVYNSALSGADLSNLEAWAVSEYGF